MTKNVLGKLANLLTRLEILRGVWWWWWIIILIIIILILLLTTELKPVNTMQPVLDKFVHSPTRWEMDKWWIPILVIIIVIIKWVVGIYANMTKIVQDLNVNFLTLKEMDRWVRWVAVWVTIWVGSIIIRTLKHANMMQVVHDKSVLLPTQAEVNR